MVYVIQVCWQLASCQQTYMTYTIAVCTVENSWWWTKELSETCGVSIHNKHFEKLEKLVRLVGSIIRNLSRCTATWTSNLVVLLCTARSHWPRGLRHGSAAARLLRLWVRIQPGAWMSVCWERCVLSGRSLCEELISRAEGSYRLWCVVVCVI